MKRSRTIKGEEMGSIVNVLLADKKKLEEQRDELLTQPRRNPLPLGRDEYEKIVANRPKL